MKHYICTGSCGAVKDTPGVCGSPACPHKGEPFMECNCEEGKHEGFMTACVNCGELCKLDGGCGMDTFREEIES